MLPIHINKFAVESTNTEAARVVCKRKSITVMSKKNIWLGALILKFSALLFGSLWLCKTRKWCVFTTLCYLLDLPSLIKSLSFFQIHICFPLFFSKYFQHLLLVFIGHYYITKKNITYTCLSDLKQLNLL